MKINGKIKYGAFVFGLLLVADAMATVVLDFRPQAGGAANPGDGTNRINVTVGSGSFPIDPPEIRFPFADNVPGTDTPGPGEIWGGEGLQIGGADITFTVTEIVGYNGAVSNGSFRLDGIGLGMGIDSAGGDWFMIDGQESFSWAADTVLRWEGFSLRTFGSNGLRALTVRSPSWAGLSSVNPAPGITFDSASGKFTVSNTFGNVAEDGVTLEELVGTEGPPLDFSSITVSNIGSSGTAIQTFSFDRPADPVPVAVADAYQLHLVSEPILSVAAPGILENDAYTGALPLFALLVDDQTAHGDLTLYPDGSFTYDPDNGYSGTDFFTYKAYRAGATSEVAQVDISVFNPVAPVDASPLPFEEPFDVLNDGTLENQNHWIVRGKTAAVQTNFTYAGKSAELVASSISQNLSNGLSAVWSSFRIWTGGYSDAVPVAPHPDAGVVFYMNTNGNLVVYSNTVPVVLDTVIPSNAWNSFEVYCDFEQKFWNLSMNKTSVASGLPFYAQKSRLTEIRVENPSALPLYVDTVSVVEQEPVADVVDTDGDIMADWWEHKYFNGVTNAAPTDENLNAYISGLAPGTPFRISGLPLSWEGQPGRRYSVYTGTNLLSGLKLLESNILWDAAQPYTDFIHTNEPILFYRVDVELDQ